MYSKLTECFIINVPNKISHQIMSSKKDNTDVHQIRIVNKYTPDIFNFEINKKSLEISERKHSQIAILALSSLILSEAFLGNYLHNGKGINLLTGTFDNINLYIISTLIIQSLHEIIFRGGFPSEQSEKLVEKEILIGRISMLSILSLCIYEIYYDNPLITNDFKTIVGVVFLYFKILFSIGN